MRARLESLPSVCVALEKVFLLVVSPARSIVNKFCPFSPLFSALEALINFAYNGHLAIDQQNVQSLLMGASFLQLQNIKDACCTFLRER